MTVFKFGWVKKALLKYTQKIISIRLLKKQKKKLKAKMIYDGPVEAPQNQVLAKLKIIYDDEQIGEYDLLSLNDVKKFNIFSRLMKSLNYLIWGDV